MAYGWKTRDTAAWRKEWAVKHPDVLAQVDADELEQDHSEALVEEVRRFPSVGMLCTVVLVTDTLPAIVRKVNKRTVVVEYLEEGPRREVDKINGWPVIEADGLPDKPTGRKERMPKDRIIFGRATMRTDYSF